MKAYCVTDLGRDEMFSTIVFADDRGRARMLATHTDACEDAEFVNIRAVRKPQLDKYYRGNFEMDWNNDEDRIAMVRECNFECSYEIDDPECEWCAASQWCGRYERMHENG